MILFWYKLQLEGTKYTKFFQISLKSPIKSENKQISSVLLYISIFIRGLILFQLLSVELLSYFENQHYS